MRSLSVIWYHRISMVYLACCSSARRFLCDHHGDISNFQVSCSPEEVDIILVLFIAPSLHERT